MKENPKPVQNYIASQLKAIQRYKAAQRIAVRNYESRLKVRILNYAKWYEGVLSKRKGDV